MEVLDETIGGGGLNINDLERIRIPGGGGTMWEVPTLEGPEQEKELRGIILAHTNPRVYWAEDLDGGREPGPPDCSSDDGVHGAGLFGIASDGNPAGKCADCPMNQWGSAGQGSRAKGCREQKNLVMVLPGNILPVLVSLPVSSIPTSKKFMLRLASRGMPPYAVETVVTLEAQNKNGMRWSTAQFEAGRTLSAEERSAARNFASTVKDALASSSYNSADTIDS
jgi:hypothetical protein